MAALKITPAHSIEAKDWSEALLREFIEFGLPLDAKNCNESTPTAEEANEALAVALGYATWSELIEFVSQPHEATYITETNNGKQLIAERLSKYINFDYTHGIVSSVVFNSGIGFSPAERRLLKEFASPWGEVYEEEQVADGVKRVHTSTHGGLKLTSELADVMPLHLTLNSVFYEEDESYALVYLAFPNLFPLTKDKADALGSLNIISSLSLPRKTSKEVIEFLRENRLNLIDLGYDVDLNDDPTELNRDLNDAEKRVINYVSECVRLNKRPIAIPSTSRVPTLADWLECLESKPRVYDMWPMTNKLWKEHFYISPSFEPM